MAEDKKLLGSPLVRFLFLVYVALMIWLLFLQRMETAMVAEENWNFVFLATLKLYWKLLFSGNLYYARQAVTNLAGNVFMFIPLGIFLPAIWSGCRKFLRLITVSASLIFLIETLQYVTGLGSCDVDDLLLNSPRIIIGYFIWKIIVRKRR